ncbi:hypothetical protein KOI35_39385 [Actinoplanes bogorensis]|uniref:DUF6493 domain-containing protein n=1 Tax=Paractinoplanes bogorensis TaxID=1610840 RepID=A0ABS5Z2M3_9ACTN|nr:DUF6493 family protein [Actinoplanes bogorensis]MBU2669591.1 hypothetical protein [Actinoplanes bogorensis]
MASVDEIVAALADVPSADRVGWRFADEVSRLDQPVTPPSRPVPAWFRVGVENAVGWLAGTWPQRPLFRPIRALDRAGIVTPAHDDAYVLAMVSALGDRGDAEYRLAVIRADHELRDDLLWRVFEVEGGGEVSLTNVDKFSMPGCGWADAFRTLVAEGALPRERVLNSCLAALGRDFSAYRAGFFARLFDSLTPTPAELATARPRLLRLLSSTVPATVAFAARHLATTEPDEEFLDACPPALVVPAKNTPLALLRLVARAAPRHPERAAEVAAVALEHRHRDVQLAALQLLREWGAGELVASRLDLLEPSVAQQATAWFGLVRPDESPAPSATEEIKSVSRTPGERAAALMAGDTDPWEIEQFLADVAAGRAPTELNKPARRAFKYSGELRHVVAAMLLGERPHLSRGGFLALRLREIQGFTGPRTLLATPSDPSGWLDPAEFVARLAAQPGPARHDLIAALLRLHPDGREAALRKGDVSAVVRYALGGPPAEIDDHALWVAAARTRAPLDDDPHLIAAGVTGAGRGHAARLTVRLTSDSWSYQTETGTRTVVVWEPQLEVEPRVVRHTDEPTVPGPEADFVRWQAQTWPHDAETFLAAEIEAAMSSAYGENDGRTPERLDALLAHPGRLGPMAATVVAAALTAQDTGCRIRAAEALTTLVPRRIPVPVMAGAMALLAEHATATRWAAALRDTGDPHTVIAVLSGLLPRLPYTHRGLNALIETLMEECVRANGVPGKALDPWLSGFTGSSKAARSARDLAKLMP